LRSFVPDGELVGGFDPQLPGFFWAAGQGGYGIQSAPGAGQYYASVLLGEGPDSRLSEFGFNPTRISPSRFQV
jgi:D-arginine dehydrogenase